MIQEIKDFINQNIKENGKGGITGTILNSVLNKIADWMQTAEKKVSAKKTLSGIFRLRSYEECGFYGARQDVLYFPWLKDKIKEEEDSNHFLEIDWAITSRADLMNLEKYGEVGYSEGSYTLKTKAFIYKKYNYINASVNNMILGIDGQSKGSLIPDIGIYLQYCSRYYNKDNKEEYQQSPHGDTILWLSIEVNSGTNGFEFDDRESWGNLSYGPAYIECRIDRVLFDGEEIPLELCVLAKDAPNYYGNYYYGDITKPYPFYVNYSCADLLRPIDDLIKDRSYGSSTGKLITINQNGAVTRWQNTHLDFLCLRELDLNLPALKSKTLSISGSGSVINIEQPEPRSCIIRWQPQSEIKDEMYFLYHDLVYMPMFDNLQDGERHILHLDWLYEHQVALDDAERTDGGSVEYIGGERLHSVLTVRKYAGNMYCELTTKVVETTRRNDDAHQNRFHTPQIRYNYADDRTHTRASRVYLQDYIFSERFNYDGENAVGTHFKLTLVSALLDGSPVPLTQFVFADNTGNVDYYRDEEGNENSNATSDGRYVYNADSVGDTDISVKVRAGDKTQTSKFTLNSVISDHEITIDVPEQEPDGDTPIRVSDGAGGYKTVTLQALYDDIQAIKTQLGI